MTPPPYTLAALCKRICRVIRVLTEIKVPVNRDDRTTADTIAHLRRGLPDCLHADLDEIDTLVGVLLDFAPAAQPGDEDAPATFGIGGGDTLYPPGIVGPPVGSPNYWLDLWAVIAGRLDRLGIDWDTDFTEAEDRLSQMSPEEARALRYMLEGFARTVRVVLEGVNLSYERRASQRRK